MIDIKYCRFRTPWGKNPIKIDLFYKYNGFGEEIKTLR